jgi:predicted HTH domain antitoxin
MGTITLELPDEILDSHDNDLDAIRAEMRRAVVIWEYLNDRLSLTECGEILKTGYRGFLELLWSRGIPLDGMSEAELAEEVEALQCAFEE